MALLLKSLRQEGITVPTNPEVFIECHDLESIDREITKEEISFDEWKRVPIEKGKEKYGNENCKSSETKDRVYDAH